MEPKSLDVVEFAEVAHEPESERAVEESLVVPRFIGARASILRRRPHQSVSSMS